MGTTRKFVFIALALAALALAAMSGASAYPSSVIVSLVGDEDNFGYGGTGNPPCVYFDNAQAPDDVVDGVKTFDLTFVRTNGTPTVSWTHTVDLAGGAPISATLQVREHFADPGHGATITIDGESQSFYANGGSQCDFPLIQTFAVPVGALADGEVDVTVADPEPEDFALDWARLTVEVTEHEPSVSGKGRFNTDGGGRVDFTLSNEAVTFVRSRGERFSFAGEVESITGSCNTATLTGTGSWNGVDGYTFEATVVDNGSPGAFKDTIKVVIRDANGAVVFSQGPELLKPGDILVEDPACE